LDGLTKEALNHAFMLTINSTAAKMQLTVADAVKEFYGKDTKAKQRIINRIFPQPKSNN
jgi:hypothetical protein